MTFLGWVNPVALEPPKHRPPKPLSLARSLLWAVGTVNAGGPGCSQPGPGRGIGKCWGAAARPNTRRAV